MSSVLVAPARRVGDEPTGFRGRAARALAREEGRRLVGHPIFLAGLGLSVGAFAVATKGWAPVMARDDVLIGGSMLPLAAATLLAANLAALRSRRHGTDELFEGTDTERPTRVRGQLWSLGWAGAVAAVLGALEVAYLATLGAVGVPDVLELLAGPAVVVVMGALGVALAVWWPTVLAGPVALVGIGAIQLSTALVVSAHGWEQTRLRWLGPWVSMTNGDGNPAPELVIRPARWHLLYLSAAAVSLGAFAVLRHRWGIRPALVLVAATALVVGAAKAQTAPTPTQIDELAALVQHPERSR